MKICFGIRVACLSSYEQYSSEDQYRVCRQIGLTQERDPQLVVTDNVPSMQRVLIAEVWDELRDFHQSSCPWNDDIWVHLDDVGNESSHSLLLKIEAKKEIQMPHSLEGLFTFFKTPGLRHGVALKEGIKVPVHFHRDACDMCGDVVGGPPVT